MSGGQPRELERVPDGLAGDRGGPARSDAIHTDHIGPAGVEPHGQDCEGQGQVGQRSGGEHQRPPEWGRAGQATGPRGIVFARQPHERAQRNQIEG